MGKCRLLSVPFLICSSGISQPSWICWISVSDYTVTCIGIGYIHLYVSIYAVWVSVGICEYMQCGYLWVSVSIYAVWVPVGICEYMNCAICGYLWRFAVCYVWVSVSISTVPSVGIFEYICRVGTCGYLLDQPELKCPLPTLISPSPPITIHPT